MSLDGYTELRLVVAAGVEPAAVEPRGVPSISMASKTVVTLEATEEASDWSIELLGENIELSGDSIMMTESMSLIVRACELALYVGA